MQLAEGHVLALPLRIRLSRREPHQRLLELLNHALGSSNAITSASTTFLCCTVRGPALRSRRSQGRPPANREQRISGPTRALRVLHQHLEPFEAASLFSLKSAYARPNRPRRPACCDGLLEQSRNTLRSLHVNLVRRSSRASCRFSLHSLPTVAPALAQCEFNFPQTLNATGLL
jgi:hypothetical protein